MTENADDHDARERLERERDRVGELIAELRREGLDEEQAAQSGDLTHYDQHPADQASEMFEREKDLAILEQLEFDLAEIEAALQRLDEGTYGVDEETGRPIVAERLEAFPTAWTNVPQRDAPGAVIVRLLLFATAREAAGRAHDTFEVPPGAPLERVLVEAVERYGDGFGGVLATARVWLNGDEPAAGDAAGYTELHDGDEVAVLPPVSGGAGA